MAKLVMIVVLLTVLVVVSLVLYGDQAIATIEKLLFSVSRRILRLSQKELRLQYQELAGRLTEDQDRTLRQVIEADYDSKDTLARRLFEVQSVKAHFQEEAGREEFATLWDVLGDMETELKDLLEIEKL
jgi:hypothetical protein